MINKKSRAEEFILKTKVANLDLLPSSRDTFRLDFELTNISLREFRLNAVLKPLREQYDYIFIDTPPNLGQTSYSAFVACNYLVVVYTAAGFALAGIGQLLDTVISIQDDTDLNINQTVIIGHLWNMYNPSTTKMNGKIKRELEGLDILGQSLGPISQAAVIEQSHDQNQPVTVFAPKHKVSNQYRELTQEFLKIIR